MIIITTTTGKQEGRRHTCPSCSLTSLLPLPPPPSVPPIKKLVAILVFQSFEFSAIFL